ncbi:C3hc zinc finger-like protein [Thalictrum thalictroides]|uniref:C3hc zinc finger-like protein n=1 Tax=Thalictrum thalictroides TaxID=46969 RepID=A0A7J6X6J0_THATH|nr:C3hc zinc finger-like protein [Thalictrum thalictroides]
MTEEDSEKRFHSVMDKLFNTPKPKSISRNQSARGKKRGNSVLSGDADDRERSIVAMSGLNRSLFTARSQSSSSSKAPLCRPWDRGDLMKRLATFKPTTWFGKPKVVSAVNCARRGWINVEMDVIACEACGARLLFSTPSSWTHQQIEKTAAVFSLKLDNGHKVLCPWMDNVCDESLAQFPPTPAPALIDGYRERSSALLQLSALPIISSSAIDHMRCPQLESFLEQSLKDFVIGSIDTTQIEQLDDDSAASASSYYQAQKLISLCGWEPRLLPYTVDCKDWSAQAAQNIQSEELSPHIVNIRNAGVVMYMPSGIDDVMDVEERLSVNARHSDPASVVLDCKLCGASAGLWAFSTVPRPLEWFRIVQSLEVNGQNASETCDAYAVSSTAGSSRLDGTGKENYGGHNGSSTHSSSLNLSIAGGLTAAKQNYRATVTFPIISRHLIADLSSKSSDHKTFQCNSFKTNSSQQENNYTTPCKLIVQSEDVGTLTLKRNEDGLAVSRFHDHTFLNENNFSRNKKNDDTLAEGCCLTEEGNPSDNVLDKSSGSRIENLVECSQLPPQSSGKIGENVGSTINADTGIDIGSQGKEGNAILPDVNGTLKNQESTENSVVKMSTTELYIHQLNGVSSEATQGSVTVSSTTEANTQNDNMGSDHLKVLDLEGSSEKGEGVNSAVQHNANNENVGVREFVKDLKRVHLDQANKFDPIWQHRHFCPWIVSTGKTGPGWRLTLSALEREKVASRPSQPDSPSSSMFENGDPITSVRNLFKSPSTKRVKTVHDS